jgi:tetratricopeptide (TPR) repeat protein
MIHPNRRQAEKLDALAQELERKGRVEEAIQSYNRAIEIDPQWATPYYNLGLIHKYRGEWRKSLDLNLKAATLDLSDQPSWWNMGIAATALKDWRMARVAWTGFGIKLPQGDANSEIRIAIGQTPVRLRENKEVVWGNRIDPARIVIESIPTKASNRRFRDIVLNDGAPNGFRKVQGHDVPVFDELELFQASEYHTYAIWVQLESLKKLEMLEKICHKNNLGFENWTTMLRHICRQCSEGTPHEVHDKSLEEKVKNGQYQIAVAAKNDSQMEFILSEWQTKVGAEVLEFEKII